MNPPPDASLKTLGMLPDRELPELDEVLAANVEPDRGLDDLRAEMLHRYAPPAVSTRVLSHIGDPLTKMACRPQAAFLAYFVRVDPNLGIVLLAQYQLSSISALEQKVLQYPKGTRFVLDVDSLDPQTAAAIASAIMKFADAHGVTIGR